MKLYWAPQTRSSRAVWMLEEAGVDYEIEAVDIRAAERRDSDEFRAASPMGKVPALVDGDVTMSEKFNNIEPNPARSGWGSFDLMVQTLEAGLAGKDWILGSRFSAADVMVGSSIVFMRMFDMLPESQVLADYADRCLQRPAYQRALALEKT